LRVTTIGLFFNQQLATSNFPMSWLITYITYVSIGWLLRAAMIPVVLRRQFAPGAAIAWLGIVFLHPYVGVILYFLISESKLRPGRIELHHQIVAQLRHRPEGGVQPQLDPSYRPMILQAEHICNLPVLPGNCVDFLADIHQLTARLIADIDAATAQVHLLYYIFTCDSQGMPVIEALIRAAGRKVKCMVLMDAVGSRPLLRSDVMKRLTAAGVEVAAAMPVARLRQGLRRVDLRNHRKLAVIDDRVAYAGSHNLIDAGYGGRRGNPWVDVTGRFTGPVVAELGSIFREDWAFETDKTLNIPAVPPPTGRIAMQVVPTGPALTGDTFRRLFLGAVQCAKTQLIMTTPYFVPDEPTLVSLLMAADRGVDVKLIVPEQSDTILTAFAGRAHFGRLLDGGVSIYCYQHGLLHSKTTTVDDAFALIGSANLDVRSFNLNFEMTVLMYEREITESLRKIQTGYIEKSVRLDKSQWAKRNVIRQYAEGAVSLMSPLL
jgi:cardiolipin synthase